MSWQRISPESAAQIMSAQKVVWVDVRDERSFASARIAGAVRLDNHSAADFVENTDKSAPVLVYCYHGNSSQSAAAWLADKGFEQVYSVDGGFEYWRAHYAIEA